MSPRSPSRRSLVAGRCFLVLFLLLRWSPDAASQVNTERFRRTTAERGFFGSLDLDATIMAGNTDFQLISSDAQFRYDWTPSYTLLALGGGIGWADGKRFINRALVHLRYGHNLDTLLSVESFVQLDTNNDRKLLLRQLLGLGPRLQFLMTETNRLAAGIAYMFEREKIDSTVSHQNGEVTNNHRLSLYLSYDLQLEKYLRFLTVTYYQPRLDALYDVRLLSESMFSIRISEGVSLTLKLDMRYDSRPPEGIRDIDLGSKLGVSFRL